LQATGVYLSYQVLVLKKLLVNPMSAQEEKKRQQHEYQQRVDAVRSGQQPGRVMLKRPEGAVAAKNARSFSLY